MSYIFFNFLSDNYSVKLYNNEILVNSYSNNNYNCVFNIL